VPVGAAAQASRHAAEQALMRARAALLWIACAAFVAYLSFVPLRYQPLDFGEALERFAHTPYLHLGAGSRADWVANILMFLPLGALAAAFFVPRPSRRFDLVAILPSLVLGSALAVLIEFFQLYFPNRTVSLNDIVAEVIGTLVGAVLWSSFGARGREWWGRLVLGGRATSAAALGGYVVAYVVLSFSPFDVVISVDELRQKFASDLYGPWLAPISCGRSPCAVKLFAEALAVLPFGWWWAQRRPAGGIRGAALMGAMLGVVIELAQFLLVSGTSQGASVVSRAVGAAAGAWLYSSRRAIVAVDWVRWGRPAVLTGLLPWLATVAYVAGWFGGRWLGIDAALARFGQVELMPFFYQYYSTEQSLIRSTLVHFALYVPAGVAVWLWGRRTGTASSWAAAALAGVVAIVAETGKLFVKGKHPDYTDVLFAMAAAWAAAAVLRWASAAGKAIAVGEGATRGERGGDESGAASTRPQWVAEASLGAHEEAVASLEVEPVAGLSSHRGARVAGATLLLVLAVSLLRFPVWQAALAVALAAYGWLLIRRPLAYLIVLPAALPLLDLATSSGRFFWDEFDFLLAATLGVRLLMAQPTARAAVRLPRVALSVLALSVVASAAVALWPPAPLDANAFSNYLSPYNALRVAKGYLWTAGLLWLLWRDTAAGRPVLPRLQLGLGFGLLAAVIGVFWERLLFVGLAGPGAWFRAAGLVSATHVGGAYLEAMLVVLMPFALASAVSARQLAGAVLWFGVALLGGLAVLMTLSRAAAAAWLVVVGAFGFLWILGGRRAAGSSAWWRAGSAAAMAAIVVVTVSIAQSTYLRDRLSLASADLGLRLAHWSATLEMMRGEPLRQFVGMGLGSFPREFYLARGAESRLPAYRVEQEPGSGRTFLALSGGRGMFLDQRLDAAAGRELRLRGLVRSSRDEAKLSVALCEKSFLASVSCDWVAVPAGVGWQPFDVRLKLPQEGRRFGPVAPVSLSLHNAVFGVRVDVTQLSLLDGQRELVANGSFAHGLDRWLMHSDLHLAWRALHTWLQIAFEQGGLGVLAWLMLALAVATASAGRTGHTAVAAAVAASVGLALIGCFETLLDSPRQVLLATMVLWPALARSELPLPQVNAASAFRPPRP
jgi:VanZ family protein